MTASHCERLAKRTRDATQSRRLLVLAEVYDGGSRTDASRIGGVGLQIIRDWVLRFNARGPDGLVDGKSPGAPSKLMADHRRALAEVVEAGPVPAVDGVVRWRRKDLGAVALGDVRHLARRDHGRSRVEGARLRQDLGAAAPRCCHGNLLVSSCGLRVASCYEQDQLQPASVSCRDNPARRLAVFPVSAQLPRCGGSAR